MNKPMRRGTLNPSVLADVHVVDRNASGTQPAKFLVLLIKDKGAPALVPAQ